MIESSSQPVSGRRKLLSFVKANALAMVLANDVKGQQDTPGLRSAFRIPGEFEPSEAVWLGFDTGHKDLTAALLQALSPHVKLKLLVPMQDDVPIARALLRERGLSLPHLEMFVWPQGKFFLRDVTTLALAPNQQISAVHFRWSEYGLPGWCNRRYLGDKRLIQHCTGKSDKAQNETCRELARLTGASLTNSALFIEGGAVEVNGQGLIIANESLLKQRNPGVAKAQLEKALLALPGVRKVIWLPEGLAEDPQGRATIVGNYVGWGTGGHTDEFVRFADASTVLLAWPDDDIATAHPVTRINRMRMQRNFDILSRASGLKGEKLRVLKVPMPKLIERRIFLSASADRNWSHEWTADFFLPSERRREGDPVMQVASASYLNFVIANDVLIVPEYTAHGTSRATQDRVRRVFELAFKGKEIVFVDAITANWVGGGPHCATLKQPVSV